MLGVTLRDRIPNNEIRIRTGIFDGVEQIATIKWRWQTHSPDYL